MRLRWPSGIVLAALTVTQLHAQPELSKRLRDGDLLFQHIGGEQGLALQLATKSRWTHVGIAFKRQGRWEVLEAVGPVKFTPLAEWVEQGNEEYVLLRLADADRLLDEESIQRLLDAAKPLMGIGYDWKFQWGDELMYCSELVWKLYERALGIRLCEAKPMREYHLSDSLVLRVMHDRYGNAPPLDEPMVAPSTLIDCPLLVRVGQR
ncbi:MAG: hypothetical protein IPK70_08470 [Flavobacteriales bacterium]|jgi:hypothetical protein|nr:hypothetical protein [Flavobacteriales bacterium]